MHTLVPIQTTQIRMQWDFDTLKRPCPPLPAEAFEFGPPGKSLFETTFRSNFLNMFLYAIFTKRMSSCPSFWMRMQLICTALQAYTVSSPTPRTLSAHLALSLHTSHSQPQWWVS